MTRLPLLTAALVTAVVLTGCQGSDSATDSSTPTPTPTFTDTPTVTLPPTQPPTLPPTLPPTDSAGPSETGAGLAPCRAQDLQGALTPDAGGGTAGAFHSTITLTLKADSSPCSVRGFPTVHYVSNLDDALVGAGATHDGPAGPEIDLTPGAATSVALTETDPYVYLPHRCRQRNVAGLLLVPPGGGQPAVILHRKGIACSSPKAPQLHVGTFTAIVHG